MRYKVGDKVIGVSGRVDWIEKLCSCGMCRDGSSDDQYYYLAHCRGKRGHELKPAYKIGEQLLFNFEVV